MKEILSFRYKNSRYDIDYEDNVLNTISKNKKILGKTYILNNSVRNDLQVELVRDEIIYNQNYNVLMEDELMFKEKLFQFCVTENNLNYNLLFDITGFSKIKLERIRYFSNEDGFMIVYKEQYSTSQTMNMLELKRSGCNCYGYKEFEMNNVDNINFDKNFNRLWKIYLSAF